jgi:hypothetical protein
MFCLGSIWSCKSKSNFLEDEIVLRCINILSLLEKEVSEGNTNIVINHAGLITGSIHSLNKIKNTHPGAMYIMVKYKENILNQKVKLDPDTQRIVDELPESMLQPAEILHSLEDNRTGLQRISDWVHDLYERKF